MAFAQQFSMVSMVKRRKEKRFYTSKKVTNCKKAEHYVMKYYICTTLEFSVCSRFQFSIIINIY